MSTELRGLSPRTFARIIGFLYLLLFFIGPLAFFMGRTSVVAPGDPATTIQNLQASESMFRIGMVAESAVVLIEIIVSAMLYVLFIPVSRSLSLASAFARFAQSLVQAVNLLTAVPALLLIGGMGYLSAFEPDQLNALVLLFMDINAFGIMVWGILFGFHLLLLGTLVYRSSFLPRILGILLILGGTGYWLQSYGHFLAPQFDELMATVVIILSMPGELAFTVWLLWKGVDVANWEASAREVDLGRGEAV